VSGIVEFVAAGRAAHTGWLSDVITNVCARHFKVLGVSPDHIIPQALNARSPNSYQTIAKGWFSYISGIVGLLEAVPRFLMLNEVK